jgi:hypothetical protein
VLSSLLLLLTVLIASTHFLTHQLIPCGWSDHSTDPISLPLPIHLVPYFTSPLILSIFISTHSNDDQLKKPQGETAKSAAPLTSRKRVNLIDMKRGQNAGIALARIKMSFAEVKERISLMDDEIFTTDQLRSLSVRTCVHVLHCTWTVSFPL